jgi:hypothetical protein
MQTYQPPPENPFDELLSDFPPQPSEEEVRLKVIYSQWIDLHAATRRNLLNFEMPDFKLPRMATGEQEVKDLVRLSCVCLIHHQLKVCFSLVS